MLDPSNMNHKFTRATSKFSLSISLMLQQLIIFFWHQQPIYAALGYIHYNENRMFKVEPFFQLRRAGRMVQPVQNFGMPNLNFTLVMKSCQKVGIFHFQSQFWRPKMTLIFLKMVFSSKITLVEQLLLKSF